MQATASLICRATPENDAALPQLPALLATFLIVTMLAF